MKNISKRTVIIGGGTFYPIRNHFSLAAPAFGTTAKYLHSTFPNLNTDLYLTKMAGGSTLNTNEDIDELINILVANKNVGTIIMSAAMCDFNAEDLYGLPNGPHAERLKTSNGTLQLNLYPAEKVIRKIRLLRPDIFLVGFKTSTNLKEQEQYYAALKFMKQTKCNLVLANDTTTRLNMTIVPEEARYHVSTHRSHALNGLSTLIQKRQNLTYNSTLFELTRINAPMSQTSHTFQTVLRFLINNKAFISDNGNNFTPGHFCYKLDDAQFLSSQRKQNHNNVFATGLTHIVSDSFNVFATGTHKPSVGATSQQLLFKRFPEYDCIIHTHNPLKEHSKINRISQYDFQCGSIECGENTLSGMSVKDDILSVYLEKHGANIMFKSTDSPAKIIAFIKENIQLGVKVQ